MLDAQRAGSISPFRLGESAATKPGLQPRTINFQDPVRSVEEIMHQPPRPTTIPLQGPNKHYCHKIEGTSWTLPRIFIYLFGVVRRFQHCTGHITTGSWKGRGNQYIQLGFCTVNCRPTASNYQLSHLR